MATSMRRALMPLHRMRFSNLKNAEALLEVRYPLPFVVPIRTKKRYPRSGDKRKGSSVGRSGGQSQSGRSTWRETLTSPALTLAVYDRFGRLMMGSEEEPRDVLEYLVLERHLVNHYGMWRLHGKIEPAWAPVKEPIVKTVMILGPELKPGEEFEGLNYEVPKPKAVQWHK